MSDTLLKIDGVSKHFDGIQALDGFSCSVNRQEILGLIGPNGAGKTTLFNVLTGFLDCDRGQVLFNKKKITQKAPHKIANLGITRTFQDLRLIKRLSVLQNVLLAFKNQPGEHMGNIFFRWKHCQSVEAANTGKALSLLEHTGLRDKANARASDLSYGQQKLLSITCCLAADAELLLLDEPVAGIAPEMIEKIMSIVRELPAQGKTVVVIEHNMDVVMQYCQRIIFMDAGQKVSEGTSEEVRNDPRVIEAYLD